MCQFEGKKHTIFNKKKNVHVEEMLLRMAGQIREEVKFRAAYTRICAKYSQAKQNWIYLNNGAPRMARWDEILWYESRFIELADILHGKVLLVEGEYLKHKNLSAV